MHTHQYSPVPAKTLVQGCQQLLIIQIVHIGFAAVPIGGGIEDKLCISRQRKMRQYLFPVRSRVLEVNIIFGNPLLQNRPVILESLPIGIVFPFAAGQEKIHILRINFGILYIFLA